MPGFRTQGARQAMSDALPRDRHVFASTRSPAPPMMLTMTRAAARTSRGRSLESVYEAETFRSHASRQVFSSTAVILPCGMLPALFTRMSRAGPCASFLVLARAQIHRVTLTSTSWTS